MNGLQKFYIGLWSMFALALAVLFISGSLTMLSLSVLGFVGFGLIFMGMMCVLPATVTHPGPPADQPRKLPRQKTALVRSAKAWLAPLGVEMDRPHFR